MNQPVQVPLSWLRRLLNLARSTALAHEADKHRTRGEYQLIEVQLLQQVEKVSQRLPAHTPLKQQDQPASGGKRLKLTLTPAQVRLLMVEADHRATVVEHGHDERSWRAIERACQKALAYHAERTGDDADPTG